VSHRPIHYTSCASLLFNSHYLSVLLPKIYPERHQPNMLIHTILWSIFLQRQIIHCALLDQIQAPSLCTHSAPYPLDTYGIVSNGVTVASGPAAASFTGDPLALLGASGIRGTGVTSSPSMQSQSLSAVASLPPPGRKVDAVATITAPPAALSTCQPGACYGEATVGLIHEFDLPLKRL